MRLYRPLLILATLLAFGVIALGAYVRLSDAGLGCPDWPGCYGHLLGVPDAAHEKSAALLAFPDKPVETHKAWKEMAHRYFAGALGLLVALIAGVAWKYRRHLEQGPLLPTALLGVIVFQALLGMWTVTLLLRPAIVSAHLLGGMATLALLVWLLLAKRHVRLPAAPSGLQAHAALTLCTVAVQIALGGWVSSNYAALACTDFPTCLGGWLPEMDFSRAFQIRRELGENADGTLLPIAALTAIHWSHRVGALVVTLIVGALAIRLVRHHAWRAWGVGLGFVLLAQIALGVANVLLSLPLALAVAHNAGAALLLALVVGFNVRLGTLAGRSSRVSDLHTNDRLAGEAERT
jgi:cytochrome c oxidase assembly protein subunit 15